MAQELGIVEKSPDFVNPYREDAQLVCSMSSFVMQQLLVEM